MKSSILIFSGLLLLTATPNANAFSAQMYANTISAHNIGVIQHTITTNAFNSFKGSMATALGKDTPTPQTNEDPHKTYGRAPMYGTASIYGEYNDDGRAGRSGGDTLNANAALNNLWVNWYHLGDNAKFDDFSRLEMKYDTIMFGIAGGQTKMLNGLSKWGLYTGYVGGTQENKDINIDGNGGYFGIYNGNTFGNLSLFATVNGGVLNNSAETMFGSDEFTNFWLGGAIDATYDYALDATFTLQPGTHIGYTWVRAEDYQTTSGSYLENEPMGLIEFTPHISAIKHIGNGWIGAINLKYTMLFTTGGDTIANSATIPELDFGNFTEYTLSLEKSVYNFNFSANFGRRDGARDGWIGGLNIKYLF